MTLLIEETRDIATCRALRRVVFIEEQGVSEADEIDECDEDAIHLLARVEGQATGSARGRGQAWRADPCAWVLSGAGVSSLWPDL